MFYFICLRAAPVSSCRRACPVSNAVKTAEPPQFAGQAWKKRNNITKLQTKQLLSASVVGGRNNGIL